MNPITFQFFFLSLLFDFKRIRLIDTFIMKLLFFLLITLTSFNPNKRQTDTLFHNMRFREAIEANFSQTQGDALKVAEYYEMRKKDRLIAEQKNGLILLGGLLVIILILFVGTLCYTHMIWKTNRLMRQAIDNMTKVQETTDLGNGNTIDENKELFLRIDRCIEEEKLFLNPDLNRDDICEMFDIDKNKIGQIIKAYSGSNNLSAYLNRKRVQYAVLQMRKHPNWKIPAIAEACGIPSISSFNRIFKQVFGMSPTDFAQQDLS